MAPKLPQRQRPAQSPAQFLDDSLSQLTPKQVADLRHQAAKEAIDLELERQRTLDRYKTAEREMMDFEDRARNVGRRRKQGVRESYDQTFKTASGEAHMNVSSGGGPCYVATAVYGDTHAPEVWALRRIRDGYLLPHSAGRAFVRWYYRHGSALALRVAARPAVTWFCRKALNCVVRAVRTPRI